MNARRVLTLLIFAPLVLATSALGAQASPTPAAGPARIKVADEPGSWTSVTGMPTARAGLGAAGTPDGLIYAIGGANYNNALSPLYATVEAYSIAARNWQTRASLPTPTQSLGVAADPGNQIYAIGGLVITPSTNTITATDVVYVYNEATNRWATIASLPGARWNLASASDSQGKIYAMGGIAADGSTSASLWMYDPSPSARYWATLPSMPTARSGVGAAFGPGGSVYAFGGWDANGNALSAAEAYNVQAGNWTTLPPMPTPRADAAVATGNDGLIYVMGGWSAADAKGNTTVLSTVEAFNPMTNAWSSLPSLPTARAGLAGASGTDGRVYAVGGYDGGTNYYAATERYTTFFRPRAYLPIVLGAPTIQASTVRTRAR